MKALHNHVQAQQHQQPAAAETATAGLVVRCGVASKAVMSGWNNKGQRKNRGGGWLDKMGLMLNAVPFN